MSEPTTAQAHIEPTTADVAAPVEPTTVPAEESKPVEPVTDSTAAAPLDETATPAAAEGTQSAAAIEDKPAETAAAATDAPVEPVSSGVLGYKAPGLIKQFKFSKRFFWLGEEAVSTQHLSHYLRGTEAKIAHPVAAWSSQTGKGLLYLVKTEAEKSHPQDVLPLSDATDLQKAAPHEFHFKIHGEKHAFKAANDAERNGWFVAIEKAIEEAKATKDEIRKSDGYQESVKHLGKPAALAGGAAAGAGAVAAAKKEETPASTEPAAIEPVEEPAHVASTSDASDEELKKEKKDGKKSRSVSRGKRASIFGSVFGKKDEKEVKKEEEKTEEKHVAEGAATGAVVGGTAAAVAAEDKPEEVQPEETTAVAPTPVAAEAKEEAPASPKPSKRNSIFGSFMQKVKSPATEKKESEVAPIVPPKDETPAAAETTAPVATEPVVAPAAVAPAEDTAADVKSDDAAAPVAAIAATEEKKAETPKKEKESFLGSLLSKARAKSPAAGKRDVTAATPAAVDAPAVPPKDEAVVEEPKVEDTIPAAPATTETTVTAGPEAEVPTAAAATTGEAAETKATSPKESRRRSFFGGFGKKDGEHSEGETTFDKLGNMLRRPSQAIRRHTDKKETEKENAVPAKTEEAVADEPAAETAVAPVEEKATIGDVPAEAISVGQPQEANPTVSATA